MQVCKGTLRDPVRLPCAKQSGKALAYPTFWHSGEKLRTGYIIQCADCPTPRDRVCDKAIWVDHDWPKLGHAKFVNKDGEEPKPGEISHDRDQSVEVRHG